MLWRLVNITDYTKAGFPDKINNTSDDNTFLQRKIYVKTQDVLLRAGHETICRIRV